MKLEGRKEQERRVSGPQINERLRSRYLVDRGDWMETVNGWVMVWSGQGYEHEWQSWGVSWQDWASDGD